MPRSRSLVPAAALAAACALTAAPALAAPPDVHPRLWVRGADLDGLRKRASPQNPIYQDGLRKVLEEARQKMDAPPPEDIVSRDSGSWSESYTRCSELFAQVFAFMYLLAPDGSADKQDLGKRARALLMNVIDKAYAGLAKFPDGTTMSDMAPGGAKYYNEPWAGGSFPINLRTFIADAFPLTVDWIYPVLSAADKAKIRTVFLYWSRLLIERSAVSGEYERPKPGLYNDPALLDLGDRSRFRARWAMNNWFAMHMRLLGLMALSMDAADDVPQPGGLKGGSLFNEIKAAPAGALRDTLRSATGAFLYMVDQAHRMDGRGGLSPEGLQYFTAGVGPTAQLHLALKTSGWDDPALYPQRQEYVSAANDTYYEDLIPALLSQVSPVPLTTKWFEYYGPLYQGAWYGDGERYVLGEMVGLFGPLARYHELRNDAERAQAARWAAVHLSSGGPGYMTNRVSSSIANGSTRTAILYFLAMDPDEKPAPDPRPKLPLAWYSPGIQSLSVRTGWDDKASWLSYMLPWNKIDHQHGDANMVQLFRKGEWLTKKWVGYGARSACSEFANNLTVLNDPPKYNSPGSYQNEQWKCGSQWEFIGTGDPLLVGWSDSAEVTYAYGDATPLYNSESDGATQTSHVSRSMVWLKPDHVILYDRVASKKEGAFKRLWLNFENEPKIEGPLVTATTKGGQRLFVRSLSPDKGALSVRSDHPLWDGGSKQTATGEPMAYRLMVEAPADSMDVRFTHVLQGADAGAAADPAVMVRGDAGAAFEGVVVRGAAVLFPKDFGEPAASLGYEAPADVKLHVVTGLSPDRGYRVSMRPSKDRVAVAIGLDGDIKTDKGGVLLFDGAGKARPLGPTAQGGAAPLEAIRAAAAGLPPPSMLAAPALPPAATATATGQATSSPVGTPPPRGCGCGGAGRAAGTTSMAAALGALALVMRRRRGGRR